MPKKIHLYTGEAEDFREYRESVGSASEFSDIGFVSRGTETNLQSDLAAQKRYFAYIQQKYLEVCASVSVESLRKTFRTLTLTSELEQNETSSKEPDQTYKEDVHSRASLDSVIFDLRRLREAVQASDAPIQFEKSVLLFSARTTALMGHYQSYVPSVRRLLDTMPLSEAERHEVGAIYILHIVHFNNDIPAAFEALAKYNLFDDLSLRQIVRSWADWDYVLWRRRLRAETDPARLRIMMFGDRLMAIETLKRLGKAYFFMQKSEIEKLTGWKWEDCVNKLGCGWYNEENDRIVMRQRKRRIITSTANTTNIACATSSLSTATDVPAETVAPSSAESKPSDSSP
ncbi:hypothetical protein V1511DRAFT_463137 [Dipodascopsis uninucleata]